MFKILKGKKNKKLWQLIGLIFLVGALVSGLVLVKQSQDIRGRACEGDNCFTDDNIGGGGGNGNGDNRIEGGIGDRKGSSDNRIGGGDENEGGACNDNSDCPNGRHCQNGRCLSANRSTGVFGRKCDEENPCDEGRECSSTFKRCMSENNCRKYSGILKCE